MHADALLGRFADTAYAYRFGPPPCDVAVTQLRAADGRVLAEDFCFPQGLRLPMQHAAQLKATGERQADGRVRVTLWHATPSCSRCTSVHGYLSDDAHSHLAHGCTQPVCFCPHAQPAAGERLSKFKLHVGALNLREAITLRVD